MTDKGWLHQANLTCFSRQISILRIFIQFLQHGFYDGTRNKGEIAHFLFTVEPIKRLRINLYLCNFKVK